MDWTTQYLDPNLNTYTREKMIEQYNRENPQSRKRKASEVIDHESLVRLREKQEDKNGTK
jgi:hypothetical protein